MPIEDRIGNLNLVTFERQEFLKKISSIRNAFRIEMRDTKTRAVEKARAVMIRVYEEMKVTFDKEFKNVVDQYNDIIYQMKKMENRVRQVQDLNKELEKQFMQRDTYHQTLEMRFIPMIEDFTLVHPDQMYVTETQMN